MNIAKEIRGVNWLRVFLFYGVVLAGTYIARKLPNLLQMILERITDIPLSFNYNHGIITLLASLIFYKLGGVKQEITLLGNKKIKSLLFPVILFAGYTLYGMSNSNGIDRHAWAFIVCSFALVYNIMEEYAWRGYLVDSMGKLNYVLKSCISGVFWCIWHLLVFSSFEQYGGFGMFFAFCIIFSFILTFAVLRTRSILVAATIHAFIIQINIVAGICFAVFMLLLWTWNRKNRPETTVPSL